MQADLEGIEWGGDVHVPHGDLARAREVRSQSADAGLIACAYGSYYRVGHSESEGLPFERVLQTAVALGAPLIRVWVGKRSPQDADARYWHQVMDDVRRIAALGATAGVKVALEFHRGTLTETVESAIRLLQEVAHPNLCTLWQPVYWVGGANSTPANVAALQQLTPYLENLHVFHWTQEQPGQTQRWPLAAGEAAWHAYLDCVATTGRDHWLLLEFVCDASPAAFLQDARTLRRWLGI